MDTGLDEDHAELGVHVLSVGRKVLVDGNSLFDEVVEVLRDFGGEVCDDIESSVRCTSTITSSDCRSLASPAARPQHASIRHDSLAVFKIRRILLPVTLLT